MRERAAAEPRRSTSILFATVSSSIPFGSGSGKVVFDDGLARPDRALTGEILYFGWTPWVSKRALSVGGGRLSLRTGRISADLEISSGRRVPFVGEANTLYSSWAMRVLVRQ